MWNLEAQKQRGFSSKADGICRYYRYSCLSQNQTAQSDTQHVLFDFQHNQGRPTVRVVSFYSLYQSARPARQSDPHIYRKRGKFSKNSVTVVALGIQFCVQPP